MAGADGRVEAGTLAAGTSVGTALGSTAPEPISDAGAMPLVGSTADAGAPDPIAGASDAGSVLVTRFDVSALVDYPQD